VNRTRSLASILVFALAAVLLPAGIIGYWGHRTVTDAERYLSTVGPLAESPEVQDALAEFLTLKIQAQVNSQELVQDIFGDLVEERPSLKLLEPVVAGAIDALISEVTFRIVHSEKFVEFWQLANSAAQESLMAILEGRDEGPIRLEGDDVVLDISEVFVAIQDGLIDRGLTIAARFTIPDKDRQIVLLEAPQLAQLRTIYSITSPVLAALVFVALALFVVAIFLSRRRPRMVAATGLVVVIVGAALLIGLAVVRGAFVNTLVQTPFGPASEVFYDQLFSYLLGAAEVMLLLGAIIFVIGVYLGQSRIAVEARGAVQRGAQSMSRVIPDGPITSSASWVSGNARWLRVGVAALFILIVVVGSELSLTRTIIATLICGLLLIIIQVLAAPVRDQTESLESAAR
jgi:hypothetical protein